MAAGLSGQLRQGRGEAVDVGRLGGSRQLQLAGGYWQPAAGRWRLANWQLAAGNWQLAAGNWQLAQSVARATAGSILATRRAGRKVAIRLVTASVIVTAAKTTMSRGLTR